MSVKTFKGIGVSDWLIEICQEMGIKKPTEIQSQCIPAVFKGFDVVGRAKTGSGKTAAFAIPILQNLARDPYGIFGLVLTPTRELAFQIADQFRALGVPIPLKCCVVVGGLDMLRQSTELNQRPHIVIATPGRLADHIRSGLNLHTEHLKYLVLDEADRLFEDCFDDDIETILSVLPAAENRQTLLFSATMTFQEKLAKVTKKQPEPKFLEVSEHQHETVEDLDQRYLFVPQRVKECYLQHVLRMEEFANSSIIVFVSTCRGCELIAQFLDELDISCVALHSRINQSRRMAALGKFRSGTAKILVATDVASRGLDIPTVQLVINYDVPRTTDDYVHRVGRTARAGRGGLAITIVSQYDVEIYKEIEKFIKKELEEYKLNEDKVLEKLKKVNQAKRMAKFRLEEYAIASRNMKALADPDAAGQNNKSESKKSKKTKATDGNNNKAKKAKAAGDNTNKTKKQKPTPQKSQSTPPKTKNSTKKKKTKEG